MTQQETARPDRCAARNAVATLLAPESVVVVGASDARAGSMPAAPVSNLLDHGYRGRIYVVNPSRDRVSGVRSYARLSELPEVPDTAVVVVGADRVPGVVRELGELGVASATVVAAGFGEEAAGSAGAVRTRDLLAATRDTGIRLLGPNTTGVVNTLDNYVPRASRNHPRELLAGSLAIVGQSGALGNGAFNRALHFGVGVGFLVATGNQLDLDLWDIAEHVLEDDRISAVAVIIESLPDPGKLAEVARIARKLRKPIVALRLGVSERGRAVVATHSGSLAGTATVTAAVFDEEQIVDVRELDELWEVAHLFHSWGVPTGRADRLAVISTSGGDAALAADTADPSEVLLPELDAQTAASLSKEFSFASVANPFDLTAEFMGKSGQIETAVRAFSGAPGFDALLFSSLVTTSAYAAPMYDEIAAALSDDQAHRVAVALRSGVEAPTGLAVLRERGVPVFEGVERAIRAIGHYAHYSKWDLQSGIALVGRAEPSKAPPIPALRSYWTDRVTLGELGLPFNPARFVGTVDEAAEAADELGYPVVLKVSSPGSGHKLASGGVRLLVSSPDEVRTHATTMLDELPFAVDTTAGMGLVVERQVAGLAELFVGFHRDELFGPVTILGTGGTLTEAHRDTVTLRLPASQQRVTRQFETTRIGAGLADRGIAPPIHDLVAGVGDWFAAREEVVSVDINPVLITDDGSLVAVDARIRVGPRRS